MANNLLTDWLLGTILWAGIIAAVWGVAMLLWFLVYDFIREELQ